LQNQLRKETPRNVLVGNSLTKCFVLQHPSKQRLKRVDLCERTCNFDYAVLVCHSNEQEKKKKKVKEKDWFPSRKAERERERERREREVRRKVESKQER
jgi:hypothetical protein